MDAGLTGHDRCAVANAIDGPVFELTGEQRFRDLAKGHGKPASWAQIDPSFPDLESQALGLPLSSGIWEAFEEFEFRADGA